MVSPKILEIHPIASNMLGREESELQHDRYMNKQIIVFQCKRNHIAALVWFSYTRHQGKYVNMIINKCVMKDIFKGFLPI